MLGSHVEPRRLGRRKSSEYKARAQVERLISSVTAGQLDWHIDREPRSPGALQLVKFKYGSGLRLVNGASAELLLCNLPFQKR